MSETGTTYSHPYQLRAPGFKTRTYKTWLSTYTHAQKLAAELGQPVQAYAFDGNQRLGYLQTFPSDGSLASTLAHYDGLQYNRERLQELYDLDFYDEADELARDLNESLSDVADRLVAHIRGEQ